MFGHFSHRSEWQLVKVDYKSIFDRRCAEEDYRPWQLHSQVGAMEKLSPEWEVWGCGWWQLVISAVGIWVLPAKMLIQCFLSCFVFHSSEQTQGFIACWEVISVFIVLGYNEIKFKCAWLRLTTQNEIPTQHGDLNVIYLSVSYGCRAEAGVSRGSSILSSNANRDIK